LATLISGCSGFIGAALAQTLLSAGESVIGIDNHSPYYSVELKKLRLDKLSHFEKFTFVEGNLSSMPMVREVFERYKPKKVFHLAAQPGVRLPPMEFGSYAESNLTGFFNIAQMSIIHQVQDFLFASSSSVYGGTSQVPYCEDELNLDPSSFYGATKLSNEILMKQLVVNSGTRARGLRFFTVYGPAGRPDMAYFRLIASAISGTPFELYGDGLIRRDFTFIEDVINQILRLSSNLSDQPPGFFDLVNIGGGFPVSMNELIELTEELTRTRIDYRVSAANLGDSPMTMASTERQKLLTGASPETRLRAGLAKTIEWAVSREAKSSLDKWVESSRIPPK